MVKLIVLFACFTLITAGPVRRDTPTPSTLVELQKHAAEFHKTFSEQLNALVNSENSQKLTKVLKDSSESLPKFSTTLQGALSYASGKGKEAVEETVTNLKKTVEDLHKAHPEVEQQASTMRDKLQVTVQNVSKETENLAKVVATNIEETNKKLEPTLKAAYGDFVKHVEVVKKKLNEAANKH